MNAESDIRSADEYLFDLARARDITCPACSGSLRDLAQQTCPHCSAALEVRLGLTEPRVGAWLALVTPLLMGAGLGALWLLVLMKERSMPPRGVMYMLIADI